MRLLADPHLRATSPDSRACGGAEGDVTGVQWPGGTTSNKGRAVPVCGVAFGSATGTRGIVPIEIGGEPPEDRVEFARLVACERRSETR